MQRVYLQCAHGRQIQTEHVKCKSPCAVPSVHWLSFRANDGPGLCFSDASEIIALSRSTAAVLLVITAEDC